MASHASTFPRFRPARLLLALGVLVMLLAAGPPAGAQPRDTAPAAQGAHGDAQAAQPGAHGESAAAAHGEEQGESIWSILARLVNFALLAGGLYYFLHKRLDDHLTGRSATIRHELDEAQKTREIATGQLAEIDRKVKALPEQIATLRRRGAEEVAAESARIREQAAKERERLVEQARREIDVQLRIAKRELTEHAADLAIGIARERIDSRITDDDQARLVDRYVSQVKTHE